MQKGTHMENVLNWLASSPLASFAKVSAAAALAWLLANPDYMNLPPIASVALGAGLPVLINWLNPMDGRYGREAFAEESAE